MLTVTFSVRKRSISKNQTPFAFWQKTALTESFPHGRFRTLPHAPQSCTDTGKELSIHSQRHRTFLSPRCAASLPNTNVDRVRSVSGFPLRNAVSTMRVGAARRFATNCCIAVMRSPSSLAAPSSLRPPQTARLCPQSSTTAMAVAPDPLPPSRHA